MTGSIFLGLLFLFLTRGVTKAIAQSVKTSLDGQPAPSGKATTWGYLWLIVAVGVLLGGFYLAAIQFANALGGLV